MWVIEKRFNDFVTLYQGLSREFRDIDLGPPPKRRFFNRCVRGVARCVHDVTSRVWRSLLFLYRQRDLLVWGLLAKLARSPSQDVDSIRVSVCCIRPKSMYFFCSRTDSEGLLAGFFISAFFPVFNYKTVSALRTIPCN